MKFKFKFTIGLNEIEIEGEAKDNKDLFRQVAFYNELPKIGPTGNTNLVLSHRQPKGFEYFSIIDKDAKQEFAFGSSKESGELFCKGWKPAYDAGDEQHRDPAPDLARNAKTVHVAKEIIKEEPITKKTDNPALDDVLSKYGLNK